MTDGKRRELEARNQRIIDAVIQKSETECPGAVALIGIGGSFCSGDIYEHSDLDLMIVVNDAAAARKIIHCFILEDVGFDLYCTPWRRLEEMAQYRDPYVVKLLDIHIVYCSSVEYQRKYDALREKLKRTLAAPFSQEDFEKAQSAFRRAEPEYVQVMIRGGVGECRYASMRMLKQVEFCLFLLNKAYIRRGTKRIPEEIAALERKPAGFMEVYWRLIRAETVDQMRDEATRLMKITWEYLDEAAPVPMKKEAEPEDIAGTYEEIWSDWLNKMRHSVDRRDVYLSMATAASCQEFYDEMYHQLNMDRVDLMSRVTPSDLKQSAEAFEIAMGEYLAIYQKLNQPVKRYKTLDEFEARYLCRDDD